MTAGAISPSPHHDRQKCQERRDQARGPKSPIRRSPQSEDAVTTRSRRCPGLTDSRRGSAHFAIFSFRRPAWQVAGRP